MEILNVFLQFNCLQILTLFCFYCDADNSSTIKAPSEGSPFTTERTPVSFQTQPAYYSDLKNYSVFYTLESILDALNQTKFLRLPCVVSLLRIFEDDYAKERQMDRPRNVNYPFIVMEGTHRILKDHYASRLSAQLGARLVGGLPECIRRVRGDFNNNFELKRLYFYLAVYITSFNVRFMLQSSPVLLVGYWIEQAAFNLARDYDRLPPENSSFYDVPTDLVKPDLVFFHNCFKQSDKIGTIEFNLKVGSVVDKLRGWDIYKFNASYVSSSDMRLLRSVVRERLAY